MLEAFTYTHAHVYVYAEIKCICTVYVLHIHSLFTQAHVANMCTEVFRPCPNKCNPNLQMKLHQVRSHVNHVVYLTI